MENKLQEINPTASQSHAALGQFSFSFAKMPVVVKASDATLMTDAGILPLRHLDHRTGLSTALARCFSNPKLANMKQPLEAVIRQRILGIAAGYEDANDHDDLRLNPGWQVLVKGDTLALASQPTISRVENSLEWDDFGPMAEVVADFGARQVRRAHREKLPAELLLDIDSTDDPTHGQQQLAFFNGHYQQTQYQVLCVSEPVSKAILTAGLLPGTVAPAKSVMPDLKRAAAKFPGVKIHVRADAGFSGGALLDQLEEAGMGYTMRLVRNPVLMRLAEANAQLAQDAAKLSGKQEVIFSFAQHKAEAWSKPRTVVIRCESGETEAKCCFLVTSRKIETCVGSQLEFEVYAKRGSFEHRFDELKNELSMDRLSCSRWRGNAVRVVLHVLAYGLTNLLRLLDGIPKWLKAARAKNWIEKVFKAAARVRVHTRRVVADFDRSWPGWLDFTRVCDAALAFR
jgi:hypothetical protein